MNTEGRGSSEHAEVVAAARTWRDRILDPIVLAAVIALAGLGILTWLAQGQSLGGKPLDAELSPRSLQWWLRPVERNRFLRPSTADERTDQYDLRAAAFSLNGENGWAVGNNGVILRTTNGGLGWTLQVWSSPSGAGTGADKSKQSWLPLVSAAFAFDGNVGLPNPVQLAQQQQQQPVRESGTDANTKPRAKGVQPSFPDGGESRTSQPVRKLSAIPDSLFILAGQNQTHAVVITGGRPPYRYAVAGTVPRGLDFQLQPSGQLQISGAAQATSGGDFLVVVTDAEGGGDRVEVRVKVDVPATQAKKSDAPPSKPPAPAEVVPPKQDPLASPPPPAPLRAGSAPDLNDVHFLADGRRGWIVGKGGTILLTRDGGKVWEQKQSGETYDLHAVTFEAGGARGWAVGDGGLVIASEDGGATWKRQKSGTTAGLKAIVVQGRIAWAVGEGGDIRQSANGGVSWEQRPAKNGSTLYGLSVSAVGKRALAVGEGGTVVITTDGGEHWLLAKVDTRETFRAVTFSASGQRGWTVGDNGTVFTTMDGGAGWEKPSTGTRSRLRSIAFADDAQRGIIVGDGFTILTTRDGGRTWAPAMHRLYPAPWFYLAGLLILAGTAVFFYLSYARRAEAAAMRSIIDKGESDEPIDTIAQDRLGFASLVKGLTGYLRNRATVPPLTIAINAPWGGGKSSVMRMLRTEMRSVGVHSVWFNAWHHQQEGLMLAALLESIRAQALPFWATREGIVFRTRLLWRRICTHPFIAAVSICAVLLALSQLLGDLLRWADRRPDGRGWVQYAADTLAVVWDSPDQGAASDAHLLEKLLDGKFGEATGGLVNAVFGAPEAFLFSIELAVLAAAVAVLFLFGFRSFPGSPAVLLATVASQFRIGQAEAQTSYRQRFKTHFLDVCEALRPRTMLIFIDDLDRCAPDKTAEILEAINYLVSSGPCFVVIGMARPIVETQLGIHFHRQAEVKLPADSRRDEAATAAASRPAAGGASDTERARTDYVRNYLRKLINLEVHIPQMTEARLYSLLHLPAEVAAGAETANGKARRANASWQATAEVVERALRGRSAAAIFMLLLVVVVVKQVQPGIERWDETRIENIRNARKEAEDRLNTLRDAERRAAVALDFARGKEKRIASELFDRYRVAVAGLEFRLPIDPPRSAGKNEPERCAMVQSARPKRPAPPVALEDSDELFCWRTSAAASRAVEAHLAQIRASLAAALTARSSDSFDRIARELDKARKAAESAEQLAGMERALPPPLAPRIVSGSAAQESPSGASAEGRRTERDTAAYVILFALLGWAALYALTRRDPYVLRDQPRFQDALRAWSPLLTTQKIFAVPRETKRFQNRARFYAVRLRHPVAAPGWLSRLGMLLDGRVTVMPDGRTSIQEEIIVALTAIHQLCPELLTSKSSPLFDGNPADARFDDALVAEIRKRVAAHNERSRQRGATNFAPFPEYRREVLPFLEIVEEFEQEPDTRPPLKAAA